MGYVLPGGCWGLDIGIWDLSQLTTLFSFGHIRQSERFEKVHMKKILFFIIALAFLAPQISCGGRIPQAKSAQSLTKSYFKSYGRKYKESIFGKIPVDRIEINQITEQSFHIAEIEAFLNFRSGEVARVLLTAKNSPPFGWSVVSWEMVDLR